MKNNLSIRIKEARKHANLTQDQLAKKEITRELSLTDKKTQQYILESIKLYKSRHNNKE